MIRRTSSILLVVVALLHVGAATASASRSSEAIAAVNELRTRMGTAPIVNDETLAGDCGAHVAWMGLNGSISHTPSPGSSGYTAFGADAAARSVLHRSASQPPQSSASTIHWKHGAPLHLYQLLHPALTRSGYAWDDGYACMWTLDPKLRRSIDVFDPSRGRDQLYTWPPIDATDVPMSEDTSAELPNPNVQLGLPREQVTGPYMLVYVNGFGNPTSCAAIRILSATITASDGAAVPVRWWDDARTIERDGLASNMCPIPAGGGFLVAEQPLRPGVTYTTRIELVGAQVPLNANTHVRSWTFRTSTGDRARPIVRLRGVRVSRLGRTFAWRAVATVRDASPTNCSASVQRRRVRCVIRAGRIVLAGRRRGMPQRVAFALVVRDAAGNVRRMRFARRVQ